MNTTVKAIFISIGSFFSALFLIFAIGMCTPGFRQMMFRVWNVVPQQQYVEKANSESTLTTELNECNQQITQLSNERQALLDQVATLDATNLAQAEQIAQYTSQIEQLDRDIAQLQQRFSNISNRISNGSIRYLDTYINIEMPIYDTDGNYMHHGGYGSNGTNQTWYRMGVDLLNEYNNNYKNAKDNTLTALQSNFQVRITTHENYDVTLDGGYSFGGSVYTGSYTVKKDATIESKIIFNGQEIDEADLESQIVSNADYTFNFGIEYEFDANNRVISILYTSNIANN